MLLTIAKGVEEIRVKPCFCVLMFDLQIMQTTTEEELRSTVATHYDVLCDCGFTRPSSLVKEKHKVDIIQALALHCVILRSKAEIDQFCKGLVSCGVLVAIRRNPDLARNCFCVEGHEKLTSGEFSCVITL